MNEDNALTQIEMSETLKLFGLHSFEKQFNRLRITMKILTKITVNRNSEKVISLRQCYAMDTINHSTDQLVYLAISGLYLHTHW